MMTAFVLAATPLGLATSADQPTVETGDPIKSDVEIEVRQVRRVGQKLTVEYAVTNRGNDPTPTFVTKPSMVSPSGKSLPVNDLGLGDFPQGEVIKPGATIQDSVTFDIIGTPLDTVVYQTEAKVFNESTWFFVIGGQRIPFKF